MKKRTHIQIAIDALKKQYVKYESERDKAIDAQQTAADAKNYFEGEMDKLAEQIASLEGAVKEAV